MPETETPRTTNWIRCPETLKERLQAIADAEDRSLNWVWNKAGEAFADAWERTR